MKKYVEPEIEVIVIDVEDDVNNAGWGEFSIPAPRGFIFGGDLAEIVDDELVNDHGYNNEGFDSQP